MHASIGGFLRLLKNRRTMLLIMLGAVALSTAFIRVYAASGDLDPTFGNGGKVTTDVASRFEGVSALVIQPDGKIVAGGESLLNPDFDDIGFALARYNSNGSLDPSFGVGGKVITNLSFSSDEIGALAIQSDGKIIAAGQANSGLGLVRYNSDGSLDVSFGSGGKVLTPVNARNFGMAMAAQSDGKILVTSSKPTFPSGSAFLLVRYNSNGSLDSGFGSGGIVTTSFEPNSSDNSFALAIEDSGRIIVAGNTFNGVRRGFALARYESNGNLVPSFGSMGKVITVIDGVASEVLTLALQSDGRIQAAGISISDVNTYAAYLRYDLDGTLDPGFGTGGALPADSLSTNDNIVQRMAIVPDGHIFGVGNTRIAPADLFVVRYNSNGNFDSTFGQNGKTTIDFHGGNDTGQALAIQGDGKVIAAGGAFSSDTGFDFALARLEVGPTFDACVQDDSTGNLLKINTTTGDYQFTNCSGVMLAGQGSITRRGGLITLQHNASDRRVLARLDTAARKATASIQLLSTGATFNIVDTNTANNTCVCR
jgi:uncharacterized delta-60 repeat protein